MEPNMPFPEKTFRIPSDNSPVAYCNFDTHANAVWFCKTIAECMIKDEQGAEILTVMAKVWPEEQRFRPLSQASETSSSGDAEVYYHGPCPQHSQHSYSQHSYPQHQQSYRKGSPSPLPSPLAATWGGKGKAIATEFPVLTTTSTCKAPMENTTKDVITTQPTGTGTSVLADLMAIDKQMGETRKTIVTMQENMATVAALQENMKKEMVTLQQRMQPLEEKYNDILAMLNKRIGI